MEEKMRIDVIILSYAQTEALKKMTENCINSLIRSEDLNKIEFNVILIESEKSMVPYQYDNTLTIYPDNEFGYHRYMNLGIKRSFSPYVCICNNDLIFFEKWATNMLVAFESHRLVSGSPACGSFHPANGYKLDGRVHIGYRVREQIAGWCIFFKRDILKITGSLDENLKFWFADDDYANTLWMLNLRHGLVTSSRVDHLESMTLVGQTLERREKLTFNEVVYIRKKWDCKKGVGWIIID